MQLECDQWRAINAPDPAGEDSIPAFGSEVDRAAEEEENDPVSISNPDPREIPDVPVEEFPGNAEGNLGKPCTVYKVYTHG